MLLLIEVVGCVVTAAFGAGQRSNAVRVEQASVGDLEIRYPVLQGADKVLPHSVERLAEFLAVFAIRV